MAADDPFEKEGRRANPFEADAIDRELAGANVDPWEAPAKPAPAAAPRSPRKHQAASAVDWDAVMAEHEAAQAKVSEGDVSRFAERTGASVPTREAKRQAWLARQPGPLPEPSPSILGELGDEAAANLKAIPAAFNDTVSSGVIPQTEEALGIVHPGDYQRAREAGPVGDVIGSAGGMLLNPLGKVAAPIAGAVSRGVGGLLGRMAGGAAGAGTYAAADSAVRGNSLGQTADIATDAAAAGALLPAVPAVAKAGKDVAKKAVDATISRAEHREAEKVLTMATKGQAAKTERALVTPEEREVADGGAKALTRVARENDINGELVKGPEKFRKAVDATRETAGQAVGGYIRGASELTPGIPMSKIRWRLKAAQRSAGKATDEAKAIGEELARFERTFGNESKKSLGDQYVPLTELWARAQELSAKGYSGVATAVTPSKELGRLLSHELRTPLYKEVDRIVGRNPSLGTPQGFADARKQYGQMAAIAPTAEMAADVAKTSHKTWFRRTMEAGPSLEHRSPFIAGGAALMGSGHGMLGGATMLAPELFRAGVAADQAAGRVLSRYRSQLSPGAISKFFGGIDPAAAEEAYLKYAARANGGDRKDEEIAPEDMARAAARGQTLLRDMRAQKLFPGGPTK